MGMTMTQKILAAHAGLESVTAGQLIEADLDLVLGNDITSPSLHSIVNVSGNLPAKMKLRIILTSDKWELNMRCCQKKG